MHESLCCRQIDGRAAHLCQGTQCLRAALIRKSAALAFKRSKGIQLSVERCRDVDKNVRNERRCNGRGVPVGFTHRFVTEYLAGCLRMPRPRGKSHRNVKSLVVTTTHLLPLVTLRLSSTRRLRKRCQPLEQSGRRNSAHFLCVNSW